MAGLSPFTVMTNIFVTEFSKFSENIKGKLNYASRSMFLMQTLLKTSTSLSRICLPTKFVDGQLAEIKSADLLNVL